MKLPATIRQRFGSRLRGAFIHRVREEQGQSLVETAISMMMLLCLIFAVIEASWGVYSLHYLANAAHEAARYAIVRGGGWGPTCDGTGAAGSGAGSSMCQASPQDIANFVASRNFPGISITASDVCVEYFSSVPANPSTTCNGNTGPNADGDIVQVTIDYPFSFPLPFVGNYTWNLTSTSQMVIAQ